MRVFSLVLSGILLVSCATPQFPFKYYKPKLYSWQGELWGPTERDDLPAVVCDETVQKRSACVIMMADEFFLLKENYLDIREKLNTCERK